jgi:hypothetical protein
MLSIRQSDLQLDEDTTDDIVLQNEKICEGTIESIRPHMITCDRIHELDVEA